MQAFAKINLYLRVGPPHRDGYHPLLTLFQSISLADQVRVRYDAGGPPRIHLEVTDPGIPTDGRNTVVRAWRFLREWCPAARSGGFTVRVQKYIPVGSGLGGASADAAAFLAGAASLLHARLPPSRAFLSDLARRVGADVPFCLQGGTAIGRGLGDVLTRIAPLPRRRVLIVSPKTRILTKEAYRLLDRYRRAKNLTTRLDTHTLYAVVDAVRKRRSLGISFNDFQLPVCRGNPDLALIASRCAAEGLSAMSGSGSAFFVIPEKTAAKKRLRAALPKAKILEAHFVLGGYRRWKLRRCG